MKINIEGIEVFIEANDQYLQINDLCGAALYKVWEVIKTNYANYEKWICYHNTDIPYEALRQIGAVLVDDSIEMRLSAEGFHSADEMALKEDVTITPVTTTNFDTFAAYHDEQYPDMYWTSERIRRDLSQWGIFALWLNHRIKGSLLLALWQQGQSEIYCVDAPDQNQYEALIAQAAAFTFKNGKKEMLYMADENTLGQKAASAVGLAVTGFYKGWKLP